MDAIVEEDDGSERHLPPFPLAVVPPPPALIPSHHDVARPLVLCVWDSPNMDASLFSVVASAGPPQRPRLEIFARWLTTLAVPATTSAPDIEGVLFHAVAADRATALAPFISAVRQSGLGVFCRDRNEGDIDDAIDAFVTQRLTERAVPGTLVLATADQPLGRWVSEKAKGAGWRVVVVAYRELCSWPQQAGIEFFDPEDIPGLFVEPLDRFRLENLPVGGTFAPPAHPLMGADQSLEHELMVLVTELIDGRAERLTLAALGSRARHRIHDFEHRAAAWSSLTDLVVAAVEGSPYELVDTGTPAVAVAPRRPPTSSPA